MEMVRSISSLSCAGAEVHIFTSMVVKFRKHLLIFETGLLREMRLLGLSRSEQEAQAKRRETVRRPPPWL